MARRDSDNDDLLLEEELSAAFLGDDEVADDSKTEAASQSDWDDDSNQQLPGQLALDVYETADKLMVKARTAGVNKSDLDVSFSDGTLTVRGTLSAGTEDAVQNYFMQECYWGEFSRSVALPVPVKEDEIEASLKEGVLTITFTKV
ncbi:MAG: Hsp20/alpha crystallin family protein, partial [Patescibacteria group bacterium]